MKTWMAAAAAMTLLTAGSLAHAQAALPVPSAGVIPDVAGASDKPNPSRVYKLALDIVSMGAPDAVNPGLLSAARLINTYRSQGVPAQNIQATAVFHGDTIALVTKDEVYRGRTGGSVNPNQAILRELAAAGVKFVVCGVSARDQKYTSADLLPGVTMNMSATVSFIDLQLQGYVKVNR